MNDENKRSKGQQAKDMEWMKEAQSLFASQLLRIQGVHGVGIGYKETAGKVTKGLALIVRVDRKLPLKQLDPRELIPKEFKFYSRSMGKEVTVMTDVQERRRPVPYSCIADGALEKRVRPVPGGYSISRIGHGTGTIGGWVWDDANDQIVLLTNNHVLGSNAGEDVLQPGEGDGGDAPDDHFADVVRTGTLDATIATPIDEDDIQLEIEGVSPAVYEVAQATHNMQVEKSGRTTEHTTGEVVMVNYISNHYGSTNDIEIDPDPGFNLFAYYGDSGSLIVERNHPAGQNWKRVVGLLWGGDPSVGSAYAHQLQDVFSDLDLTTVCTGLVEAILEGVFYSSYDKSEEPARFTLPLWARTEYPRREHMRQRGFFYGIARELEKYFAQSEQGKLAINMVSDYRVEIVNVLREAEVRRALIAAVAPFVHGAWTMVELLERTVTDDDVTRFQRFLKTVQTLRPEMKKPVGFAADLLKTITGKTLREIFKA